MKYERYVNAEKRKQDLLKLCKTKAKTVNELTELLGIRRSKVQSIMEYLLLNNFVTRTSIYCPMIKRQTYIYIATGKPINIVKHENYKYKTVKRMKEMSDIAHGVSVKNIDEIHKNNPNAKFYNLLDKPLAKSPRPKQKHMNAWIGSSFAMFDVA